MIDIRKLEQAALIAYGPNGMDGLENSPRSVMQWAKYVGKDDPEWWATASRPTAATAFFAKHPTHPFTVAYKSLTGGAA